MDDWWQVIVLGMVEGLTEFLPISSTGHLLVIARLLRFEHSLGGTFEIAIQLGAVLAVLGHFARDLLAQARTLPCSATVRRFWLGLAVAALPAGALGLLLHNWIKAVLFSSPPVIAGSLILGGLAFIGVERLPPRRIVASDVTQISLRQALWIGVAQALALVPGVSRSGASIVGGMLVGLDRPTATAFSFYLAIPTLGTATILEVLLSLPRLMPGDLPRLLLGLVVALVVAWASIRWLLRWVARNTFLPFGIYRIVAGLAILALAWMGIL